VPAIGFLPDGQSVHIPFPRGRHIFSRLAVSDVCRLGQFVPRYWKKPARLVAHYDPYRENNQNLVSRLYYKYQYTELLGLSRTFPPIVIIHFCADIWMGSLERSACLGVDLMFLSSTPPLHNWRCFCSDFLGRRSAGEITSFIRAQNLGFRGGWRPAICHLGPWSGNLYQAALSWPSQRSSHRCFISAEQPMIIIA